MITFNPPVTVVVVPEKTRTLSVLRIRQLIDDPIQKTVTALTMELGRIILWSGQEYDDIGQWTDSDVTARIQELYGG